MKAKHFFVLSALCLLAVIGSSDVNAERLRQAPTIVIVAPTGSANPVARRMGQPRLQHVVRHGAYYYAPHIAPKASASDDIDFFEDEEDEFDSADLDADGYLSFRETRRANPQWVRDFRRIDVSGDGYLTREEIEEFYRR
jgi:hypothetical protein